MGHPVPLARRAQAKVCTWDWELPVIILTVLYGFGAVMGIIGALSHFSSDPMPWLAVIICLTWALPFYAIGFGTKFNYKKGTPLLAYAWELDDAYKIACGLSDLSRDAGMRCVTDMKRLVQRSGSGSWKSDQLREYRYALTRLQTEDTAMQTEIAKQTLNNDGLRDLEQTIEALRQARGEMSENRGLLHS